MYDALSVLQVAVTKTATFNGAGLDVSASGAAPLHSVVARVIYSAATNASGANSVTFSIDESDDNSTFYSLNAGASTVITLSTTAQAGEIFLPFRSSKRYVRLTVTVAGAGSTPTVTYFGDLGLTRP